MNMSTQRHFWYCALQLSGVDLDPVEVTRTLGVSPTRCGRKGEHRIKTDGTPGYLYKQGFWCLDSGASVSSDDENLHLLWLIRSVDVSKLASIANIEHVRIHILFVVGYIDTGFVLSPEFIHFASQANAQIEISVGYDPDSR
jgi:hypothetical protein